LHYRTGTVLAEQTVNHQKPNNATTEPSLEKNIHQENDVRIRKVKCLRGRAKEEAKKQGLSPDDLVIITTKIEAGSLPDYIIEKVEGDPTSYLLNREGLKKQ